jgi:hypothetical protein
MPLLYGGTAGAFPTMAPLVHPPARVCRVISGYVFWRLLHWPWRQYLAATASGSTTATPPPLASRTATGIYVTDGPSLQGCGSPADFAWRLSLFRSTQSECQLYGCAVIELDVPGGATVVPVPPQPGAGLGLTAGGARQWLIAGNIDLARTMAVNIVETSPSGVRHYPLPL